MNCFGPSFRPGKTSTTTGPRPHISVAMGLMMIVLLVGGGGPQIVEARTTTAAQPGASNATSMAEEAFEVGDELPEGETIEWHHVKLEQDGAFRGDHPVIMYKEDFVSEDYDPSKSSGKATETSSAPSAAKTSRRYKDIAGHRRRHSMRDESLKYHAVKPEKIYFDVLPLQPVMSSGEDDDKDAAPSRDSKFDPAKIHVELIPLTPEEEDTAGKEELAKRPPKKYHHHRQRRDTPAQGHVLHKRNPYYNYYPASAAANNGLAPAAGGKPLYYAVPAPVGQFWNGLNVEVPPHMDVFTRFGDDESIVWPIRRRPSQAARRPNTQAIDVSPPASIFHDARPENADTSFMNQGRPTSRPAASRPAASPPAASPPVASDLGSIFHSSRPEEANTSFLNPTRRPATPTRSPQPPQSQSRPDFNGIFQVPQSTETPARRPAPPTAAPARTVSDCVWAIVNCCQASSSDIRYSCFERQGCVGAFWDLNPCADSVRDPIIEYVNNLYSD